MWTHISEKLRRKLDDKPKEVMLIGCLERNKHKIYLINRKIVVVSRHVTFFEDQFRARDWPIEDEDGTIVRQPPISTTATGSNSNQTSGIEPGFPNPEEGAVGLGNFLEYIPPVLTNYMAELQAPNDPTLGTESAEDENPTESEDVVPEIYRRYLSRA